MRLNGIKITFSRATWSRMELRVKDDSERWAEGNVVWSESNPASLGWKWTIPTATHSCPS